MDTLRAEGSLDGSGGQCPEVRDRARENEVCEANLQVSDDMERHERMKVNKGVGGIYR